GDLVQDLQLVRIEHPARRQWKIQKKVSVAAYDVHQHVDHLLWRLVRSSSQVVPVAYTRVGLPGLGPYLVHDPAFDIQDAGARLAVFECLARVHCIDLTLMTSGAQVVMMRHDPKPVFFKWNQSVAVEQIGLILIQKVFDPQKPVSLESLRSSVQVPFESCV